MSGRAPFEVVSTAPLPAPTPAPDPALARAANAAAIQGLKLALSALSQRFVVAIANLFTACEVASAFILWWMVLPDPTPMRLVALGGWAVFLLAIEAVRRK